MSHTVKLSDADHAELSRIKRYLEVRYDREVTLGEAAGILIRFYNEVSKALGVGGDDTVQNRP